jgi:Bacterial tandem repeat domain 1
VPLFAAIFEQAAGPPVEARHNLTSDDFQQTCNQLTGLGYRPKVLSGYHWGGQPLFVAVFEQGAGPQFEIRHNLTSDDYQQTYDQLVAQNYRPRIVSGYEWNGQPLFAVVFEQFAGPVFEARHNLSSDEFLQISNQLSGLGYHPVLINGYDVAGQPLFAAIFEQ